MTATTAAGIDGYRAHLVERNGAADLLNRRLERREEFFGRLEDEPLRSRRAIDRDAFVRNLHRRRPEPGIGAELEFLLATAKLNQAERFGVGLGEVYGRNSGAGTLPERVYMELEEHYHTRLLAYVLRIFDLPFEVTPPPLVMRQFVKLAVFMPERLGFAFVGAAEMAGCTIFASLGRIGAELFAAEAEVADRIASLYGEILADEVGHVGYCAARCTSTERVLMRRLYRGFGRLIANQTPEVVQLVGRDTLRGRFREPFDVETLTAGLPAPSCLAATP